MTGASVMAVPQGLMVTQTRVGVPAGNYTEAVIASLLGVALDDVPQLYEPEGHDLETWRPAERSAALCRWLREEHGRVWGQVLFPPKPPYVFLDDAMFEGAETPPPLLEGLHGMAGKNLDGVGHFVVGYGGRVVWDPNPSRRGIVDCDELMVLLPLDWLPAEHRDTAPGWQWLLGGR